MAMNFVIRSDDDDDGNGGGRAEAVGWGLRYRYAKDAKPKRLPSAADDHERLSWRSSRDIG